MSPLPIIDKKPREPNKKKEINMAAIFGKIGLKLFMSLLTEKFFKEVLIWALENGAKSSKYDWDDKLVKILKDNLK